MTRIYINTHTHTHTHTEIFKNHKNDGTLVQLLYFYSAVKKLVLSFPGFALL